MYEASELDWLIYNAPMDYVNLLLHGNIREYLNNVTDYHPLDIWSVMVKGCHQSGDTPAFMFCQFFLPFFPLLPLHAEPSIPGIPSILPHSRKTRWCQVGCTGQCTQSHAAEYRNCLRVCFYSSQVLIPPGSIKFSRYNYGCANRVLVDGRSPFQILIIQITGCFMPVPPSDQIYKQNADTCQECLHRSYSVALLLYHRSKMLSIELRA